MRRWDFSVRLGLLALLFAALVWGYKWTLSCCLSCPFLMPGPGERFKLAVELFPVFVLWRERRRIGRAMGAPSFVGLALLLFFLVVGYGGAMGYQSTLGLLSFVCLCPSLVWALFGWQAARIVLFPSLFLLFCLPAAMILLEPVTVRLRDMTGALVCDALDEFNVDVVRQGTRVLARSGEVLVNLAAREIWLRTFLPVLAFAFGYAYLTRPTFLRLAVLPALSVLLVVLGNALRMLVACLLGVLSSPALARTFDCSQSRFVVYLVAVPLVAACGHLIGRFGSRPSAPREPEKAAEAADAPVRGRIFVPVLCLVLVLPVMYLQAFARRQVPCADLELHLSEIPGLSSESIPEDRYEFIKLPKDTRIEKRVYRSGAGDWACVSLVASGLGRASIHRPEVCLTHQNYAMTSSRTAEAGGWEWRIMTVSRGEGAPSLGFAYAFFNQGGMQTSSHMRRVLRDCWDRAFLGRIDRWVMVSVCTSRSDDRGLRELLSKIRAAIR